MLFHLHNATNRRELNNVLHLYDIMIKRKKKNCMSIIEIGEEFHAQYDEDVLVARVERLYALILLLLNESSKMNFTNWE